MTVDELITLLMGLKDQGLGDRIVEMGDPTTNAYDEVCGVFWGEGEESVYLESVEWTVQKEPRRSGPK